jgi:SAM-dependent methyltransferase
MLKALWIRPCLTDCTAETPIEPVYFMQDTWFAGRIASRRPERHVDVGSSAKTMALVAQFIPVTMVDIRPVPLTVPGFSFVCGSITALPFADNSINSLSSLCVIEHIGLGRYGDPLDAAGSEEAISELRRVLAPGGNLYLSVPVDAECRVYFNAHRAFTRDYLLGLCSGLVLENEQFLYGLDVVSGYDAARGFGTGMFHLRKP